MMDKVLAVVPARNEARTVFSVVSSLRSLGFEAIVVDDGSNDDTADEAVRAEAIVVRHDDCKGYTLSILSGFDEAIRLDADHVITLDGDGAHNPNDVPSLLRAHLSGRHSLTIGDRFSSPGLHAHSTKLNVNRLAVPLLRKATELELPVGDFASGLRVYSRNFARQMLHTAPTLPRFGICFHSVCEATILAASVHFVPCEVRYDASQLLYTKRGEFSDFMSLVTTLARDNLFREQCTRMQNAIRHAERLRFIVDERVTIAIPLVDVDGYIFQEQCSYFDSIASNDSITTLAL